MSNIFKTISKISIILLITVFFSCNKSDSQEHTEIIWDKWGVPHIYAENELEMYYAFGWAQMHNHANHILEMYATARGKASEYYGRKHFRMDQIIHLFSIPDSAAAQYERFTGEEKQILDAFVNGINDYAKKHPEDISENAKKVLPVTAIDVLAHGKRVINIEFLGMRDIITAYNETKDYDSSITPGSNSYAIAPSRSKSGNAMLVANPHLPWSDFYLFFEAHLNAPNFKLYGVTLVGMPVLNIAFNEYLGWTHTVNTIDASDRYELTLQDNGYLLDGETLPFDEKKVVIKVWQQDGTLEDHEVTLKYSEHGPIIGQKENKAYAIKVAGFENASYYFQYHEMGKAKDIKEFENALQMMQIPMFNLVYADKDGNIMYLFNGNVPVREEGDWTFWQSNIDGTRSDLIWSDYHNYDDLPKIFNPETGFVQNANDAPWTATYPVLLNSTDFPSYMSPEPQQLATSFRAQRAINMIKEDSSITFRELVDYKLNTGMEVADRFLDDLLEAVKEYPDSLANEAASVLVKWDKSTNSDSRGAILFAKWFDKIDNSMFAIPWSVDNPVSTPDGLSKKKLAVSLLVDAAKEVNDTYGSLDIAWGEVNRFIIGEKEFPGNGGKHDLGVFRTMYFQEREIISKTNNYAFNGDTYVAVVEFGDSVKAEVLLSYGNATQSSHKFQENQLELLSQNKLRTALLTKDDALNNMAFKETLVKNEELNEVVE